jgi:hypothetical protein
LEITEKIIAGVMPHLSAETGLWTLPELNDSIAFKKVYSQYKYLDSYRRVVERMMIASVFYTAATGKDEYSSRVNGI